MRNPFLRASAAALMLLAGSTATAQVYLSDYLGTPQTNCSTYLANPPYVTALTAGPPGVGIDVPGTFANCGPIEFRGRPLFRKGIGMNPNPIGFGNAVAEFDLAAIRAAANQRLDVFEATVGIYSRLGVNGARFFVYLDGHLRESVDVTGVDDDAVTLRIPIVQASTLRLETALLGSFANNHACWGDAKLLASESNILSWGYNGQGQRDVPAPPAVARITAGELHSLALHSDGTIVIWGGNVFGEQSVPTLPTGVTFVEVAAGKNYTLARLSTGQVIGWGSNIWGQANPPGGPANVTRIAAGENHSLALRSDGSVTAWGQNVLGLLAVPVLPPGLTYVGIAAGSFHSLALRSDGSVVGWGLNSMGETAPPPLPPGVTFVEIAAGTGHSLARLSDGSVIAWGSSTFVPTPPPGISYVEIAARGANRLARRSDGAVVAWGGPSSVPVLPPGLAYVEIAAGNAHSLARRSDGSVVAWGSNASGQTTVPAELVPTFTQVAGGELHGLALRSDGHIDAWGDNARGELDVPALPTGVSYTKASAGLSHSLALRSDGQVLAWGDNAGGQINVPALPAGISYVDVAAGRYHSLARRSDGTVAAWGANASGQTNVPALPAGLTWLDVDADTGAFWSLGLVSDGTLRAWGDDNLGQVSQLPSGNDFVEIAAGIGFGIARRANGSIERWGDSCCGLTPVPTPPAGTAYQQLAAGWKHAMALRSDGAVVAWGFNGSGQTNVGPAPSGSRYVDISAGSFDSFAIAERRARVELFGTGCSFESMPGSIYEAFTPSGSDLGGKTITWTRTNGGYDVVNAAAGSFVTPPPGASVVGNGNLDGQSQFTLSAPMPVPGGTTTVLNVTTKGQIEIGGASGAIIDYTPTVAELLANPRTVFACWYDYDQTVSGSIKFHEAAGTAYATWNNVASWAVGGGATTSTLQFQFDLASGDVRLVIVSLANHYDRVVGFSQAGPSSDPGPTDLSAPLLYRQLFDNVGPMALTAIGAPNLGNANFALQLTRVPPPVPFGLFEFGGTALNPGIELSFLGMPGCYEQVIDTHVITAATTVYGTATYALPIPNNLALLGYTLACQGIAFTQATAFGLMTSNGMTFTLNY